MILIKSVNLGFYKTENEQKSYFYLLEMILGYSGNEKTSLINMMLKSFQNALH